MAYFEAADILNDRVLPIMSLTSVRPLAEMVPTCAITRLLEYSRQGARATSGIDKRHHGLPVRPGPALTPPSDPSLKLSTLDNGRLNRHDLQP